ncbi:MAG TPA: acetate kinase [Gemmatimonadaceae bacterium]|nr:acetate kinase [Gemmatimonadaceae bacterium]
MKILVLNAGSSSLKFQLIETDQSAIDGNSDRRLASGQIERIGGEAILTLAAGSATPSHSTTQIRNHRDAVERVITWMADPASGVEITAASDIEAVGHRVVHGGERFTQSVLIDTAVRSDLEQLIDIAPLHNPHNLAGIAAAREVLGENVPQVAVFDTAFHQTIPETAHLYAIPYQLYRRYRVRRYGFHGTSHRYIAYRYRQLTGKTRDETRIITLHLGNGASACAIVAGHSIDTSMGFTPLEGLVMGTRSGDIDPAILDYVGAKEGLTSRDMDMMLNKQSGLLGLSGLTADMRELLAEDSENGDRRARLAIDVFCYRVRKYIGAYLAAMNGADAIIFSGGIGENSPAVRERVCAGMDWLGIQADGGLNAALTGGAEGRFDHDGARIQLWVIPTDEELLIARDTWRVVTGKEPH